MDDLPSTTGIPVVFSKSMFVIDLIVLIGQYLSSVPNVTHYADEHVQFGGAGITVVDF